MRARLFSRVGETRGAELEFTSEATIGRHPESSLVLEPSLISSRHARIRYDEENECYVLEDLDSLNGTAVDGHWVRGSERLGHLNVVTFAGQHEFVFLDLERCARRHPVPARTPPVAAQAEAGGAGGVRLEAGGAEGTFVDEVPIAMPSFLADGGKPGEPAPVEKTTLEEAPALMPSFLAGRDEASGDAHGAGEDGLDDRTRADKLVLSIPEVLSGRAEEAAGRPIETVELDPDADLPPSGEVTLAEGFSPAPEGAPRPRLFLEFLGAERDSGRRVPLEDGENVLGRGTDAQIQPDNLDISRRHAVLTVAGDAVTVQDLGSRNHTFVNDEMIDGEVPVEPGTRLRFGSLEARLVPVDEEER